MKTECGFGILCEFESFSALGVGEEAESVFAHLLGQHHAHTGGAAAACSCECDRVGVVWLGLPGFLKVVVEQGDWITAKDVVRGAHGVSLAAADGGRFMSEEVDLDVVKN